MKVLRGTEYRELEISGSRAELQALGQALQSGEGQIDVPKDPNPEPYDSSLSRIDFRVTSGKITMSTTGETLKIQGAQEFFAVLADHIESFGAEADLDSHIHIDYFPGHDYLTEGSESLVLCFDKATQAAPDESRTA
ncbi:hypothetical protein VSH64_26285 [Amycolatopsis rhabdoformis]|uniref:Uncharacterized protein n=1 Tax=Amycolatopsis rhabdoformis TaxID=1448059 RepID=A0ABZ1HYC9_9PSEU|nr:hypothetical protein [Amycolatopsis rhabdoformis]WSE26389.1 hypothetical protein VSH64_26285 [Amycolatopsis rhabdoformis]